MNTVLAHENDLKMLTAFYRHVAEDSVYMAQYGRWIYGLHPTEEMIMHYIETDCQYYLSDNGSIIASAALTMSQDNDYHPVEWGLSLQDDEVAVVHILCVDPDLQNKGVAKSFMKSLIDISKANNKRAVRLDALCCNLPANRLYESLGFVRRGIQNWYADNTGYADFYLYEYII